MELSKDVIKILDDCIMYAGSKKYEYITPELLLLMMFRNKNFLKAFTDCGGNSEIIIQNIKDYLDEYMEYTQSNDEPPMSVGMEKILNNAARSAFSSNNGEICVRHIVNAFFSLEECYAVYFMQLQGIDSVEILQRMSDYDDNNFSEENFSDEKKNEDKNDFSELAPCLNDTLKNANPLIGRKNELDRTIQILCRKDKNNPLHIGETGVGKTAITYGLVELIRKNKVPEPLIGAKIFSLDLGSMLAGTQYRGDFEKRFKKLLNDISREEKPIIYIDEIHNLAGAGAVGEGSFDASNMLKPYLTDGHIRFIGATTFEEYKKYFEKNKSLARRFQNIEIKEPSQEETTEILNGLKSGYEKFHGVKFAKGVLEYAVSMSAKYIHERFLPDKAIDLIDEAGAYRKLHPTDKKIQTVDKNIINEVLTTICRVPVETVSADDVSGLKNLESKLKNRVFGQNEAISQVVNAVKFSKAGLLDENKPLASLLFVGPTGVGKTEIAKSLADELGVKLIRFDMSEYGEKHSVAKLIGSPAGYVGYDDGGLLTEAVRKSPSAVLLLDEIEKAHSDIYNILLQVMDYATLTDNQGRKADFRNIVVIMTSNAGANKIGKADIGFFTSAKDNSSLIEAVNHTFQPEFRNRLNKIVVFNSMDDEMASLIVRKKLGELAGQLSAKKIDFEVDENAENLVIKKGISQQFGARETERVIRNEIKPLFVDEILFGKLKNGGKLVLSAENDKFIISAEKTERSRNGCLQT